MELHEIRYFLATCRTLNFTRAAEQCHVSQPALTRAIQKLEAELGAPLFARERGNTHLTELGRTLRPQLEEALELLDAARQSARRLLSLEQARIALGVMTGIGPRRFVQFLADWRKAHPGVLVALTEGSEEVLARQLHDGSLDAVLMAGPATPPTPLRAERLYLEPFMLACAASHAFARQGVVPLGALAAERLLVPAPCPHAPALLDAGLQPEAACAGGGPEWIQAMVAAGMGVTVLPEDEARHPGLVLRPLAEPGLVRQVSLVTIAGRRWSAPLARLLAAARMHPWTEAEARAA